ncbi:MAG TPA: FMN-binding negative transcriptional regulator [Burkholderiales bacterium]|jgi:transcriptional regulator|nr:FMN-binding negative transcriptional regulator [Burkholderiales bacterium]
MIYVPEVFRERDEARLFALIERCRFATLICVARDGTPWVSHLPFLLDRRRRVLRAHMARANPHWKVFDEGRDALVVFHGPHHYVSPKWYGNHPSVPTWNYATVHVEGRPRVLTTTQDLERLLADLVAAAEGDTDPWPMRLPREYFDAMLRGIVGFEVPIASIDGKFKLSQNRPADDRPRVIAALQAVGSDAAREVAELMREGEQTGTG